MVKKSSGYGVSSKCLDGVNLVPLPGDPISIR